MILSVRMRQGSPRVGPFSISMSLLIACFIFLCTLSVRSDAKTVPGILSNGIAYRLDIPDSEWNGNFIIHFKGLSVTPVTANQLSLGQIDAELLHKGFS